MASANEFHTYAHECLKWAYEAKTEGRREQFLSLARVWTHAALAEGGRDDSDRSEIQPRENPAGRGSRRGLNWLGRFGGL